MNIIPVRNKLAYPAGVAPGVDTTNRVSRDLVVATLPGANGCHYFIAKRTTLDQMRLTGGAPTSHMDAVLGPTIRANSAAGASYAVYSGGQTPQSPTMTCAGFYTIDAAGVGNLSFPFGDTGENVSYQYSPTDQRFYNSGTNTGLSTLSDVPYFIIFSINQRGAGAGILNVVLRNLKTGKIEIYSNNTLTFSTPGGGGNTFNVGQGNGFYLQGKIGPSATSYAYLSLFEMLKWVDDPWSFWYPNPLGLNEQAYTPIRPTRPRFTPSARQIVVADPAGAKVIQAGAPIVGRVKWDAATATAGMSILPDGDGLTVTQTINSSNQGVRTNAAKSSGKVFFSVIPRLVNSGVLGLVTAGMNVGNGSINTGTDNAAIFLFAGAVNINGSTVGTFANSVIGDINDIAIDFTAKLLWIRVNGGLWNNSSSARPESGTGGISLATLAAAPWYFAFTATTVNSGLILNFGEGGFVYPAPAGFDRWVP